MAGILKVDTIQNSSAENIITQTNSTTLTIGASGDTVTLAAGATSSGFGRSGTVNWDTTKKTTGFTAVSGVGYFCDTTSGAFTVTLPLTPTAGAIVALADYDGTTSTNNITIGRNGSNINGDAADLLISNNYAAVTLLYVDATTGWRSVYTSAVSDLTPQPEFVVATGGTITTCGNYKIHTFTGPGTFTVTGAGNPLGSATVDYLVVAGGGGAPNTAAAGGGGGAGGFRESVPSPAAWTASPLASPGGALPVAATAYPVTVGAGGPSGKNSGSDSVFSTITSAGGGGGGSYGGGPPVSAPSLAGTFGLAGGSGGGGGATCSGGPGPKNTLNNGGTGNTPPVSPLQGRNGGAGFNAYYYASAGGGGAGVVGSAAVGTDSAPTSFGGAGGNGVATSISGSSVTRAGGGGGQGFAGTTSGGTGGGGTGALVGTPGATSGTANTGGGGGSGPTGGSGGSGIVIIRYLYQ